MSNPTFAGGAALRKFCSSIPVLISLLTVTVMGNHGPGTSGGGSSTASGETMKQGGAEVTFRLDYTQFEDVSNSQASRLARKAGEFDALANSVVASIEVAYGITNDIQVGGQIGYYWGSGFVSAGSAKWGDGDHCTADTHWPTQPLSTR